MDTQVQSLPIIEIPLKPANAGTLLPTNINEIVQTEYAQQYLQNIAATPSAKNIEYLLASMPLAESLVVPVWTRELIAIVPGMSAKDAEATNVMADIFKTKRHKKANTVPTEQQKVRGRRANDIFGRENLKKSLTAPTGRRVSWSTVNTLESVTNTLIESIGVRDIKSKSFKHLLQPLRFTDELVYNALFTFCGSIVDYVPRVQRDRRYYDLICVVLSSKVCVRLYGLLAHFCFWNIIHPCARSTLCTVYEKDALKNNGIIDSNIGQGSEASIPTQELEGDEGSRISEGDEDPFQPPTEAETGSLRENIFGTSVDDVESVDKEGQIEGTNYSAEIGIHPGQLGELSLLSLTSDSSLTASEKEIMFIQIEQCLAKVHRYMGYDKLALATALQALVTCCHFVVDAILTSVYSWLRSRSPETHRLQLSGGVINLEQPTKEQDLALMASNKARLRLRRLAHQAISDILDPSRIHTSTMLEGIMFGKFRPVKKATCRSRYYTTTVVARSVFGDNPNPEVAKFMNLANMEAPYVPIPGLSDPFASRASALFHARRLEKELKEQQQKAKKLAKGLAAEEKAKKASEPPELGLKLEVEKIMPRWQGLGRTISRERTSSKEGRTSRPQSSSQHRVPDQALVSMRELNPVSKEQISSTAPKTSMKMSVKLELNDGTVSSVKVETEHEILDSLKPRIVSDHVLVNPIMIPRRVPHKAQSVEMSKSAPSLTCMRNNPLLPSNSQDVKSEGTDVRPATAAGLVDYSSEIQEIAKELHDAPLRMKTMSNTPAAHNGMTQTTPSLHQSSNDMKTMSSLPSAKKTAKSKQKGTCGGDLYCARVMRSIAHIHEDPFAYEVPGPVAPDFDASNPYFKPMGSKVIDRLRQVRSWRNQERAPPPMPKELLKTSRSTRQEGFHDPAQDSVRRADNVDNSIDEAVLILPSPTLSPTDYKHLFDETNAQLAKKVVTRVVGPISSEEDFDDVPLDTSNSPLNIRAFSDSGFVGEISRNNSINNVSLSVKVNGASSKVRDISPCVPAVSFKFGNQSFSGHTGSRNSMQLQASDTWDGFAEYVDDDVDGGGEGMSPSPVVVRASLNRQLSTGKQEETAPINENMQASASRSMVENSHAQLQISRKGKEQLMDLLVKRSAAHYAHKNIMSQFSRTPGAYQRQQLILSKSNS